MGVVSENLIKEQAGDWFVTTALWRNTLGGTQYETGIRDRTGNFTLIEYSDSRYKEMHGFIKSLCLLRCSAFEIVKLVGEYENLKDERRL